MKRAKIAAAVVLALALGAGLYAKFKKSSKGPRYRTVAVERGDLKIAILATGEVEPQNRLEVKPPIAGRLEEILVREGDAVRKGQVLARMSSTERAALLDAARAKGPEELAHWEEVYKPVPLVAPMNGVIIARKMEPGQTVASADVPLVMSDRLIVKAQVDETDIAKVRIGQSAELTLDAYPDQKIPARVDHIAYEAQTVSNVTTYQVDVLPARVPGFMRSGMTANVNFLVEKKEGVLLLPSDAVQVSDGASKVLLASESKRKGPPPAQAVRTGMTDGKKIEITEGLNEGDSVLVPQLQWDGSKKAGGSNPLSPFGARRAGGSGGSGGGSRSR